MPTYLSPGVYVEEVSSGSRPIEGVGTAVAAFVGFAEKGPANAADARHELDPVHPDVRRLRRGLVPGARRVRLLPQRRRRRLRRADRRRWRRRRERPTAQARAARAAARASRRLAVKALEAGAAGDDDHRRGRRRARARRANDQFKLVVKRGGKVEETFDNVTTAQGPEQRRHRGARPSRS